MIIKRIFRLFLVSFVKSDFILCLQFHLNLATPMVQPAPRPSIMGLPFSRSAGINLKKTGGAITLFVISMIPNYLLALHDD